MTAPFICPVCRSPLAQEETRYACPNRHTYDIARQGYVNLLRKKPDTLYEHKALFQARRTVYQASFFAPVEQALRTMLPQTGGILLDAGCGEGSLLAALAQDTSWQGIGLDISKTAVQMAAAAYKRHRWCVADLCDIPLPERSVDVIVNMLTPANYGEFTRVLKAGGLLLKLMPDEAHLVQLRSAAGLADYSAETDRAPAGLQGRMRPLETQHVRYTIPCGPALAAAVYQMTPMTAHIPCPQTLPDQINVSLTVQVAQAL